MTMSFECLTPLVEYLIEMCMKRIKMKTVYNHSVYFITSLTPVKECVRTYLC